MKHFLFLLLYLISMASYGQIDAVSSRNSRKKPSEFPIGINNIEVYKYQVRKNGKVKDSTLILSQIFNRNRNEITGIEYQPLIVLGTSGEESPYFAQYREKYEGDRIISISQGPHNLNPFKAKGYLSYNFFRLEEKYLYDAIGNLIKIDRISPMYDVTLNRKTKDTLSYLIADRPESEEFVYDTKNRLIAKFIGEDSLKKIAFENGKLLFSESSCNSCFPKYKYFEKEYNKAGYLELKTTYSPQGKIDIKTYFYYDDRNRIIKEIDSTEWVGITARPYLEREALYEYDDTNKISIKTEYDYGTDSTIRYKRITKYDENYLILSNCLKHYSKPEKCESYVYKYDGGKIKEMVSVTSTGQINYYFKYNPAGLISEEKRMDSDEVTELVRYYYK